MVARTPTIQTIGWEVLIQILEARLQGAVNTTFTTMAITMLRAISSQVVSTMPTTMAAVVTLNKTLSHRHPSATRSICIK